MFQHLVHQIREALDSSLLQLAALFVLNPRSDEKHPLNRYSACLCHLAETETSIVQQHKNIPGYWLCLKRWRNLMAIWMSSAYFDAPSWYYFIRAQSLEDQHVNYIQIELYLMKFCVVCTIWSEVIYMLPPFAFDSLSTMKHNHDHWKFVTILLFGGWKQALLTCGWVRARSFKNHMKSFSAAKVILVNHLSCRKWAFLAAN